MLKKQTVWLLTMLSLMVVLSAYYILSEPDEQDLSLFDEDFNDLNVLNDTSNDIETEVTNITNEQPDEYFAMLRMEIQNERSMSKERYNNIVKSSSASTDRKSTRLNSSHVAISYAVFCLKKKKKRKTHNIDRSRTLRL